MNYIAGDVREAGCVFCNRARDPNDRATLILQRATHCFVIMNLFPYAIGHLMIVPFKHVAGPEQASPDVLREMAELLPHCLQASRVTLDCDGFNVGMNLGAFAGAGIADHFHQHIVPRWPGDASFMPVLAHTAVVPELIPVTYAKLRAEFERRASTSVTLVVVDAGERQMLVEITEGNRRLPSALYEETTPVWRSAVNSVARIGLRADVIDWAGSASTTEQTGNALIMQTQSSVVPAGFVWEPIHLADTRGFCDGDAAILRRLNRRVLLKDNQ